MVGKLTYEELEHRVKELEQEELKRIKAEKALQDIDNRYRGVVEDMPALICCFLPGGEITFVNKSYCEYFGKTYEELVGSNFLSLIPEVDQKSVMNNISSLTVDSPTQSHEHLVIAPNSSIRWQRWNNRALFNGLGKIVGYQSIGTDITEQKQVEEALKKSEKKYRNIFDNAQVGLYRSRISDGKIVTANNRMAEIFGYESPEECVEKYVAKEHYVYPELRDKLVKILRKKGKVTNFEAPIKKDDGYIIWLQFSGTLSSEEGFFEGVCIDITEQKRAELSLRQSEAKFRELADMLPQIVFETDVKGNLTFVNRNALNTFGYTKDEFASGLNAMQMIAGKDRDRAANRIRKIMSGQGNFIGSNYTAIKKDGTKFPVIIFSTRFLRNKGPAGLRGIMIDITERKRAEQEREKLQKQLIQAQKMESVGKLAGGIAHNFNNILMGVQGRTSLMMMGKDPSDPDNEHLKGIEEYVKNAVELTRDLLGFARGGKYEVKPTDLNALIKNENSMFGKTKKEIRVHGKYAKDLWTVEVDQSQIQQALLNLYVNAWQAMPEGGNLYVQTHNLVLDEEYIKPYEVAPGKYVKVSVTDTGIGMDAATSEKIFDPFFSTKQIGEGSGLGLASVYGIIKNHNGFINVYSEKGEGTTFNIYLPASEKEAVEKGPGSIQQEIQYGQGTVLLVDDEEMIIEVGQAMLESLGYRVLTAGSGKEALDLYENQREQIDLIILDMIMPVLGGGETFDRLKEIDGEAHILLSSGYSINGQAKEILDRGCSGFIQKPFAMVELSRKIREVLDESITDS